MLLCSLLIAGVEKKLGKFVGDVTQLWHKNGGVLQYGGQNLDLFKYFHDEYFVDAKTGECTLLLHKYSTNGEDVLMYSA